MSLDKILLVIDPTQDEQPAFERGLDSARLTGVRLHLYVCLVPEGDRESRIREGGRMEAILETLLDRCEADGVAASTEIDWAQDWAKQVVTAAARCSASMIFKNSFNHDAQQREQRATSDWTLMRLSPCPVLMVKSLGNYTQRRALAAVDFQSTDAPHVKLNNQVISFAQRFTDAYGSDGHFINAYQDESQRPDEVELGMICGAPTEHIHVVQDSAASAISNLAQKLNVDLIIIGTVGRSGDEARRLGNTSEQILDQTAADVLVVT